MRKRAWHSVIIGSSMITAACGVEGRQSESQSWILPHDAWQRIETASIAHAHDDVPPISEPEQTELVCKSGTVPVGREFVGECRLTGFSQSFGLNPDDLGPDAECDFITGNGGTTVADVFCTCPLSSADCIPETHVFANTGCAEGESPPEATGGLLAACRSQLPERIQLGRTLMRVHIGRNPQIAAWLDSFLKADKKAVLKQFCGGYYVDKDFPNADAINEAQRQPRRDMFEILNDTCERLFDNLQVFRVPIIGTCCKPIE